MERVVELAWVSLHARACETARGAAVVRRACVPRLARPNPTLSLWHAQTLLREFRGDGHISCLVAEGLTGNRGARHARGIGRDRPPTRCKTSRRWSDDAVVGRRGPVERAGAGSMRTVRFTVEGREWRQRIEDRTDRLAGGALRMPRWARTVCDELRQTGPSVEPADDFRSSVEPTRSTLAIPMGTWLLERQVDQGVDTITLTARRAGSDRRAPHPPRRRRQ